jgi:hypothetical protein
LRIIDLYDKEEAKEKMENAVKVITVELENIKKRFQVVIPYIKDLMEFILAYINKSS